MPDSNVPGAPDRRVHPRLRPRALAYVELGAGNGGIVLNVSEGGLAVAAAAPVAADAGEAPTAVRFRLSPGTGWIEATGQLAWVGGSQKTVGIRFVDLAEANRSRIRDWASAQLAAVEAGPPAPAMPLHVPASFGRDLYALQPAVTDVAPVVAAPSIVAPPSLSEPASTVAEPPGASLAVATPAIASTVTAPPPQSPVPAAASAPTVVAARVSAPPLVPPAPSRPDVFAPRPAPPLGSVAPMARPPVPAIPPVGVPAKFPTPVPADALSLAMAESTRKRRTTTLLLGLLVCLVALLFFVIGIGTAGGSFSEMLARFAGTGAATGSLSPEQQTSQTPAQQGAGQSAQLPSAPATSGDAGARANSNALPTGGAGPQRDASSRNENARNEMLQPHPGSAPAGASPSFSNTVNRLPSLTAGSAGAGAPSALLAPAAPVVPPAAAPAVLPAAVPATAPVPPAPAVPTLTGAVDVIASPYPSIRIPPALSALAAEPGMTLHLGALVSRVEPVYPQAAVEQGVQGVVQLRVLIGRDGAVSDVQLSSGGPDVLVEAARAAVRQWRYEPSQLGPQPVEAEERVTVTFRLMDSPARR